MKNILCGIFIFLSTSYFAYSQALDDKLIVNGVEFVIILSEREIFLETPSDNGIVENKYLKTYYISKYEITNKQFAEFLNDCKNCKNEFTYKTLIKPNRRFGLYFEDDQWKYRSGFEDYPVNNVTWYGASVYCVWLSEKSGKNIELPTRRQWLFAASEGQISKKNYSGTNSKHQLKKYAFLRNNSFNKSSKVGNKLPNSFGVFDMTGNVREWCYSYKWSETKKVWVDEHDDPMDNNAVTGSHQEDRTFYYQKAVLRGGGWADDKNSASNKYSPLYNMDYTAKDVGFRICLNIEDFFE